PGVNGASLHIYSATDDFCAILAPGDSWKLKGTSWKFSDKATKNTAQIKDKKLAVKIKSNVDYSLADNGTQGTVNAVVQFGTGGTSYCMKCSVAKNDTAEQFNATKCVAAACDPEPVACVPPGPPTTTTTTTLPGCSPMGAFVKGALPPTAGRFN